MSGPLDNALESLQAADTCLSADAVHKLANQVEIAAASCAQVGGAPEATSLTLYSIALALRECAIRVGDAKAEVRGHLRWIHNLRGDST